MPYGMVSILCIWSFENQVLQGDLIFYLSLHFMFAFKKVLKIENPYIDRVGVMLVF